MTWPIPIRLLVHEAHLFGDEGQLQIDRHWAPIHDLELALDLESVRQRHLDILAADSHEVEPLSVSDGVALDLVIATDVRNVRKASEAVATHMVPVSNKPPELVPVNALRVLSEGKVLVQGDVQSIGYDAGDVVHHDPVATDVLEVSIRSFKCIIGVDVGGRSRPRSRRTRRT